MKCRKRILSGVCKLLMNSEEKTSDSSMFGALVASPWTDVTKIGRSRCGIKLLWKHELRSPAVGLEPGSRPRCPSANYICSRERKRRQQNRAVNRTQLHKFAVTKLWHISVHMTAWQYDDPYQRQAPWPPRSNVKVISSHRLYVSSMPLLNSENKMLYLCH